MTSMELDDEEKLDAFQPIPAPKPDYPYGLRIVLTNAELCKLNLDSSDAFVGGILHGHFLGTITSVSSLQNTEGEDCARVEVQITALTIESEDEENDSN
jgi:hypothetical protein